MTDPKPTRWFHLTPDRFVIGLLVVECLLWLSERVHFPAWHKGYAVLLALTVVGVAFLVMLLWFIVALVFRLRFQFSIRSLLVLTIAVAIVCSWMPVEMKQANRERETAAAITQMGGRVDSSEPSGPAWLRSRLGGSFFDNVQRVSLVDADITDEALDRLAEFGQLEQLTFGGPMGTKGSQITDAGLKHLSVMIQLKRVELGWTHVTDVGLGHLKTLNQLQALDLNETNVTDAGLEQLKGLSQLRWLCLSGTKVTDNGLKHLKVLSRLESLFLTSTTVTDAALENIEGLSQLQQLTLGCTNVTDAGLKHLKGLRRLQLLGLSGPKITDAGLENIEALGQIEWLNLFATNITDTGLDHFTGLSQLHVLEIGGTKVTEEGVKKLQQALPNCKITR